MSSEAATWIGVGIAVATAIFGCLGWLLGYINSVRRGSDEDLKELRRLMFTELRKVNEQQNQYRHNNIDRTNVVLNEIEERLTRRIERLENSRFGTIRRPREPTDG